MDVNTKFDVVVASTEDVFGTGSQKYDIPEFQRAYAWTKHEIDALLRDLFDEMSYRTTDCSEMAPHFLGSIVVTKSRDVERVLDGQQRLTTISLILALLVRRLETHSPTAAEDIRKHLMVGKLGEGKRSILTLQPSDHSLYKQLLENPERTLTAIEQKTGLGRAMKQIQADISNRVSHAVSQGHKEQNIYIAMGSRILYKVTFVKITASTESAAFALFETLNHRGLPLNPADLIKNKLLERAGEKYFHDVVRLWEEIIANVGVREAVGFLRYYWIAKFRFVRVGNLFDAARTTIESYDPEGIRKLVIDICERSVEYKHILDPDPKANDWPDCWNDSFATNLTRINEFNAKTCRPLFLAVSRQTSDFELALKFAETMTLRYSVIADGNANSVEREYNQVCSMLRDGKSLNEALRSRFMHLMLSDDEFIAEVMKVRFSQSSKSWRRIMVELNRKVSTGETEVVGPSHVHIEHIMPRAFSPEWREHTGLSDEEHENLVGAIGNLTLLHGRMNQRVSNKLVSEKVQEYVKSDIPSTRRLGELLLSQPSPTWGKKEILRRSREMAGQMAQIWRYPSLN